MIFKERTYTYNVPETSSTVESLLNKRNHLINKLEEMRSLKNEIDALGREISTYLYDNVFERMSYSESSCREKIDFECWSYALRSLKITSVMTEVSRNKYLEKIEKETPEFTEEQIKILQANVENLYKDNFVATVKEVYGKLIGCSYHSGSSYNSPVKKDNLDKVNKTFRIRGNISFNQYQGKFEAHNHSYYYGFSFEDLLTVCCLLDGKGRPNYANNFYSMSKEQFEQDNEVHTDYFSVRAYKNGNQYVKFSEKKYYILDRINKYGPESNHELPDVMKKRYKPEHFS